MNSFEKQSGRISVKTGAVILVVGIVLAVLLERVLIPNFRDAGEAADRTFDRFEPISDMDQSRLVHWEGTLSCEALSSHPAFERSRDVVVSDYVVAYERGATKTFLDSTEGGELVPAELSASFEWWRGEIAGNSVQLRGWYTEGGDGVKSVELSGRISEEAMSLEGQRGPRSCRYEASPKVSE